MRPSQWIHFMFESTGPAIPLSARLGALEKQTTYRAIFVIMPHQLPALLTTSRKRLAAADPFKLPNENVIRRR